MDAPEPEPPAELRCPECRGRMQPVYLGELGDEHRKCEYCGTLVDAHDRSSVTHEEEETYTDERGRRVRRVRRVTRRRADATEDDERELVLSDVPRMMLDGRDGGAFVLDLSDPEAVREQLATQLGVELGDVELSELVQSATAEIQSFRVERADDLTDLLRSVHGAREVVVASEIVDVEVDPPEPRRAHTVEELRRNFRPKQTARETSSSAQADLAWKIALGAGGALTLGGLSVQQPLLAVALLGVAAWVWRRRSAGRA